VFDIAKQLWNHIDPYTGWKTTELGIGYNTNLSSFIYRSDGMPITISTWYGRNPYEYKDWGNNTCVLSNWHNKNMWDIECIKTWSSINYMICELQ